MSRNSDEHLQKRPTTYRVVAHGTAALVLLIVASQVETPLSLAFLAAAFASIGVMILLVFILPRRVRDS